MAKVPRLVLVGLLGLIGCGKVRSHDVVMHDLSAPLQMRIAQDDGGVSVFCRSGSGGDVVLLNPDVRMHAASTMKVPVMIQLYRRELIDRAITLSSNLATNLLLADAGAQRVTATGRALGADSIEALRGVEDLVPARSGGVCPDCHDSRNLGPRRGFRLDRRSGSPGVRGRRGLNQSSERPPRCLARNVSATA